MGSRINRKDFSLYLINSQQVTVYLQNQKQNKEGDKVDQVWTNSSFDSVNKFPNLVKRKLNYRDKPIEILKRTNIRMKNKDTGLYRWDIYLLSQFINKFNANEDLDAIVDKQKQIYGQLYNKITDNKFFFHRKGK